MRSKRCAVQNQGKCNSGWRLIPINMTIKFSGIEMHAINDNTINNEFS